MAIKQYEITELTNLESLDFVHEIKGDILEVSGPAQLLDADPILQSLNEVQS